MKLILAASLAIFVYGMTAALLGTILPSLSLRFHLMPRQNGTIAVAQALGLMIASLTGGPLIDNQGKKIGLIVGLALVSGALLALPKSRSFGSIVGLLFLLGLGGGMIVTGANGLASDVNEAHRASTLNLVNLFFGLGGFATPLLANLLSRNSARLCYTVASLTVFTLLIHLATPMPGPIGSQSFTFFEVGSVLGKPVLLVLASFIFLYVSCEVGIWNWLVQHLIAQGVPEPRALNILSLGFALGLLIGRAAGSLILISAPAVTVTQFAAGAMATTTYLALMTSHPAAVGILVFLAGVSMAPVFPTTLAMVGAEFPKMTSTAMGIVIASGWLGLAVSSRVIGAIAAGEPKRLKKALLVIPACSMAMIVLDLAIRSTLHS